MPANPRLIFEEVKAHLAVASAIGGGPRSDSPREIPEAITHDREAVRLLSRSPLGEVDSFEANVELAFHLGAQRQFDESLQVLDRLVAAENRIHEATRDFSAHESMQIFWQLHSGRANVLDRISNYQAALAEYRKALNAINPHLQANPHDIIAHLEAAISQANIGVLRARLGKKADGKKLVDLAVAHSESLLAADPHRLFFKEVLLIGYGYQAEVLSSMDDQKGAERKYAQAIQLAGDLIRSHPGDLGPRLTLGKLQLAEAVVLARERQFLKAREEIAEGQRSLEQVLLARPQDAEGLFARDLIRTALTGLRDCAESRPCPVVRRLVLPNLNN